MHAAGLSLWELGDLLGIHPHPYDSSTGLYDHTVSAVIALAKRLDVHPADLIPTWNPCWPPARTTALGWDLARVDAALQHATKHPGLACPVERRLEDRGLVHNTSHRANLQPDVAYSFSRHE